MIIETPEQHEKYLRQFVIDPPNELLKQGFNYQAVLLLAQSFEIFGAYFDDKPFRATGQSLKRFRLAIEHLYGYEYHKANRGNQLYTQLRALFIHTFLPSEYLIIKDTSMGAEHLQIIDRKLIIIPAILNKDVKVAGTILIEKLYNSEIKPKRIATSIN